MEYANLKQQYYRQLEAAVQEERDSMRIELCTGATKSLGPKCHAGEDAGRDAGWAGPK